MGWKAGLARFADGAAFDLCIEGHEPIGCTARHPFWSVDREEFVPAGELVEGERLLLYNGDTARVTQKLPRPGPETVYNIEVHNEHVYHVGTGSALVHNNSYPAPPRTYAMVAMITRNSYLTLYNLKVKMLKLSGSKVREASDFLGPS